MQPLLFDGEGESIYAAQHCLADVFPEVIRLISDLGECIDQGIAIWRKEYWSDSQSHGDSAPIFPDPFEAEDLAGYPSWVAAAATEIFYTLSSATRYHKGHGHHRSLADAIRYHSSRVDLSVVNDGVICAMVAVVTAWHGRDALMRWLDESVELLTKDFDPLTQVSHERLIDWHVTHDPTFAALHRGEMPSVEDWAAFDKEWFEYWASSYRSSWASKEAEEREYAARRLGDARSQLTLSDSAADLDQAALDLASLGLYEQKQEQRSQAGRMLGERQPWAWAKGYWEAFAKNNWPEDIAAGKSKRSVRWMIDQIILRHDSKHQDAFPSPSAQELKHGAASGAPSKNTVRSVISTLQPAAHKTNAGRQSKTTVEK